MRDSRFVVKVEETFFLPTPNLLWAFKETLENEEEHNLFDIGIHLFERTNQSQKPGNIVHRAVQNAEGLASGDEDVGIAVHVASSHMMWTIGPKKVRGKQEYIIGATADKEGVFVIFYYIPPDNDIPAAVMNKLVADINPVIEKLAEDRPRLGKPHPLNATMLRALGLANACTPPSSARYM